MYNLNSILKSPTRHNAIVFNLVLWFVVFWILLFVFAKSKSPIVIDYIYTFSFLIGVLPAALLNFYVLMPNFLKKEKYLLFGITFILNLLIWAFIFNWFFKDVLDLLFPDYFFISYHSNTSLLVIFSILLIATTLIKLTEDWIYYNANENRLIKEKHQIVQSQLGALRSQINPHFLFNALNVVYSLALENKTEIKQAILQLSDILRYVIYDADTKKVSLKKEMELLRNFMAFQKHRTSHIHGEIRDSIEDHNYELYPMLLLPLLENAYKHSNIYSVEASIQIDIEQSKELFRFKITNPYNFKDINEESKAYSGVGLDSIKKNLDIVYPNQHDLQIQSDDQIFSVELKLLAK